MEWFGRAKITFTHSASPLVFKTRDGGKTDLLEICKSVTPPCHLNPVLFNGHLQTMWTVTKDHGPQVYYRRRIFHADHKKYTGTFAVDFVVDPHADQDPTLPPRTAYYSEDAFARIDSDDSRPMLIVLHGLSGGSHEVYLRHAIAPLVLGDGGRAWEVCVVNSRGCANSEVTSGVLFNARATWDVRQIVNWARRTFPNRPLFGLGFSLGANIMTNYVGEEGSACPLKGAVVVGNPFDLQLSSKALQRTLLGKEVYQRFMGSMGFLQPVSLFPGLVRLTVLIAAANMKRLIGLHKESLMKHTDLPWDRIRNVTYLYEFDREVQ
ncbi:hypothetical protein VTK73DRAFT_2956 [Phialemonium thermophilum]|uniref:AB hydrolase-1 domain-containing protein n=1 Tax=Phialemonium thermophilum TaxID=223376 RepID=A0ABR3X216_9PEZI